MTGCGALRERGRPARMHSRSVPLSFPAMRRPATPPAGDEDPNYFFPTSGAERLRQILRAKWLGISVWRGTVSTAPVFALHHSE